MKQSPGDPAATQTVATRTAELETKVSQLQKLRNESESFLQDVLSDSNGVSFHRFQMVLWTVLLGIIFVVSVYDNLAMPQFSGPLLTLMGISSGTYLGFELLGKRSASDGLRAGKEVLR